MSDCKAHPYDAKRIHTDSNLKTNTSFQFAHSSQFEFASHLPSLPSQLEEETPSSHVYFGQGNHSTISLQPTVTPSAAVQLRAVMEMVRFLSSQAEERRRRIQSKRAAVGRLQKAVLQQEWRVKMEIQHFGRRKDVLQGKRARMEGFKKKKLRAVTEQTERVQLQVNCMLKGLRVRNASRSFIDRREVQEQSSFHQQQPQRHQQNRRRKIYIPITMPNQHHPYPPYNATYHPYYPPTFIHSKTQVPPWVASPKQNPSRSSHPNYNSHKIAQQDTTVQKQPILIEQLRQALTMKFKEHQINGQLDYFDSSSPSKSRNGQEDGRKSETPTPKSVIRRSSSIKWRRDDMQDKELVEIIQKSIKHIKTEHIEEQVTEKDPPQQQTPNKPIHQQPRISPVRPLRNNSDSSSIINITYDSQDKRNSKSFEREGESKIGKGSSRASQKKGEHLRQIEQSNVKIEMIDMSHSKNSNSSKSDSSKHCHTKHATPLANHFHQIEEQSEEMASLKVTPCDNHGSRNSKRQQSPKEAIIRQYLPEEQQDGQDEILKSIKLDTQSRISRNLLVNNSLQLPPEDDFLEGITLLKESRASREKGLSLKGSALGQEFQEQDPQREKGSQSEIFSKDNDELDEDFGFDSTLRLSTKSRIAKPGKSIIRTSNEGKELPRRGLTQPLKAQLSSIPSAEYESEDEDTPPTSNIPKKQPPTQIH